MDYADMGSRIRSLRKKLHMSQEALAAKAYLSSSYVGHIKRGTRVASLETLVKLCRVLDTSPDYLLEGSLGEPEQLPCSKL